MPKDWLSVQRHMQVKEGSWLGLAKCCAPAQLLLRIACYTCEPYSCSVDQEGAYGAAWLASSGRAVPIGQLTFKGQHLKGNLHPVGNIRKAGFVGLQAKEERMVEHHVLALEGRRLKGSLVAAAQEIAGLENRKAQLRFSMEERKHEIQVSTPFWAFRVELDTLSQNICVDCLCCDVKMRPCVHRLAS